MYYYIIILWWLPCERHITCLNGSLRGITNHVLLCVNTHLFGQINVILLLLLHCIYKQYNQDHMVDNDIIM